MSPTILSPKGGFIMSMNQFITDILNIQEDIIEDIQQVKQSDDRIIIYIKLKSTVFQCPTCSNKIIIHGYYERKLTHSTLVNRPCYIVYKQRRYTCKVCEYTFSEKNPFTTEGDTLTNETKINILKDLKDASCTYTTVANKYNVSKQTVFRVFDKHVDIARKPMPMVLSMDEHYFPESDVDSLYCLLLMNFETGEIIDILPSRKKHDIIAYFTNIRSETRNLSTGISELDNIKYISIDLYDNFRDIANIIFPWVTVCADSFHVIKHLTEAFKDIRLKYTRNTEDESLKYLLRKFHFVFDHRQIPKLDNEPKYNRTIGQYVNYRGIRDYLFNYFPEIKAAYDLKELYINFNREATYEEAPERLDEMILAFADSDIPEYVAFYKLLRNWRQEIINSFIRINGIRINNSYIESKNRILEKLILNAYGFSNFKRTRNRAMYCLNKYDSYTF